jgi:hypothetical protein
MISHNKLEMTVLITDICTRMVANGFAIERKSNKKVVRATSHCAFTMLEIDEIVKRYNSMIRGVLQYYSFVNRRSTL